MAGSVLAICTGNICRSPFVERVLASWAPNADITFASAGTHAVVGSAMAPEAAAQVRAWHGNPDGFTARQFTPDMAQQASLIVALTRHHRTRIVQECPESLSRCFTLRELGRLIPQAAAGISAGQASERLAIALPRLVAARGAVRAAPGEDDDIADPYGGPASGYVRAARDMVGPLDALAALLCGRA